MSIWPRPTSAWISWSDSSIRRTDECVRQQLQPGLDGAHSPEQIAELLCRPAAFAIQQPHPTLAGKYPSDHDDSLMREGRDVLTEAPRPRPTSSPHEAAACVANSCRARSPRPKPGIRRPPQLSTAVLDQLVVSMPASTTSVGHPRSGDEPPSVAISRKRCHHQGLVVDRAGEDHVRRTKASQPGPSTGTANRRLSASDAPRSLCETVKSARW